MTELRLVSVSSHVFLLVHTLRGFAQSIFFLEEKELSITEKVSRIFLFYQGLFVCHHHHDFSVKQKRLLYYHYLHSISMKFFFLQTGTGRKRELRQIFLTHTDKK